MNKSYGKTKPEDVHFKALLEEGFTVGPASMDDLPEAIDMFNAAERELVGKDRFTLALYEQEWRAPGFNLPTDTRLVRNPAGAIVGLAEVWDISNPPIHPWIWARVDPAHQNQGIGTALMKWALDRARQALARLEADVRLAPRAGTNLKHEPSTTLLEELGMRPIRYGWAMVVEMDKHPAKPVWSNKIVVQTYQHPQQAEAVYRAQDDAFQDHWGHIPRDFEEGYKRWQHFSFKSQEFDPALWFLAMDGDEIAGMALCLPRAMEDPEMGWVEVLCVRRPWRKQGLGLALLQHAFGVFYERGIHQVGLEVDSQNLSGATRLYQKAGMRKNREEVLYEIELRHGKELERTE
jgi:mycothiol synthase